MAVIGNGLTIEIAGASFAITNQQIIGLEGYSKELVSAPNIEKSTFGTYRYKQANLRWPLHRISLDCVLPEADALELQRLIIEDIKKYRENTAARMADNFEVRIRDNRLPCLVLPEEPRFLASTLALSSTTVPALEFCTHFVIFKSVTKKEFTSSLSQLTLEANEVNPT